MNNGKKHKDNSIKYNTLTKKPPSGDKNFGIEPEIQFNDIDDEDKSIRIYEVPILIKVEKALPDTTQNLQKWVFPIINYFNMGYLSLLY